MNLICLQRTLLCGALGAGVLISSYGCGGGGSRGGNVAPGPVVGVAQPTAVTASGVITGFGSVFVNGVKHEVESDTIVAMEGQGEWMGDDSRLRIGMRVRVQAEEDDNGVRVAKRIEYDDDLKGPARNVVSNTDDPRLGTFEALGQTVIVDADTLFDDDVGDNNGDGSIDIRDLEIPNGVVVVEVSGFPSAAGLIATRIDRVNAPAGVPGVDGDEYEVKGFVESVASDGSAFTINGTTFLVDPATTFEDHLSMGPELVGAFVEVKADENAMGELVAIRVQLEDDIGDRDDDGDHDADDRFGELEIEGILMSVDTSGDPDVIVINGTTIEVADASSLVGLEGARVEIKGSFDEDGVLVLRSAEPEREQSVRTEDLVTATDVEAGTLTTRLGIVIKPTAASRVEDDAADDDRGDHLTPEEFVARVQSGDHIEARGIPNADGSVSWRRVERDQKDELECELRGPVESIDGIDAMSFSFVIQGVTVNVSEIVSESGFDGIGRAGFFDELDIGDVVEAKSDSQGIGCVAGTLTAREVEFRAEDGIVGHMHDGHEQNGTVTEDR